MIKEKKHNKQKWKTQIPYIHCLSPLYPTQDCRGTWSLSHCHRSGVQPSSQGQTATNETNNHAHSLLLLYGQCRIMNKPNTHVLGLWKEFGESRENPRLDRENMETPHRKAAAGIWTRNLLKNFFNPTILYIHTFTILKSITSQDQLSVEM